MKTILIGLLLLYSFKGRAQTDTTAAHDTTIITADTLGVSDTIITDTTITADTTITVDTTGMGVYGFSIKDSNGTAHSLDSFKGKEIWLVILPSTQSTSDSTFLMRIDSVAMANHDSVQTIAIPSYEDGYTGDSTNTLLTWYGSHLDSSVLISQPLYTHIASGAAQAGLFHWLTHSPSNGHYDTEVSGVGAMFFIDGQGALNGVFDTDTRWSNKALNMMFN